MQTRTTKTQHSATFALSVIFCTPAFAAGVTPVNEPEAIVTTTVNTISDSSERIKYSGQLRTYTQQVAAASCAITSGVAPDEAFDVLHTATAKFDRYLSALRVGNADLGILRPEGK